MKRTPAVFTALALIAAVCIGGVLIALGHNPLTRLDTAVYSRVVHADPGWARLVSDFSNVFEPMVVSIATVLVAAALLIADRNLTRAGIVVVSVVGGGVLCEALKMLVARPRPPYAGQLVHETGMSYPSGHVTGSTALLVSTAVVLTAAAPTLRRWAVTAAVVLAVLVAASRVYLAAHWVSDVLAGLAAGTAAVLLAVALVPQLLDAWARRRDGGRHRREDRPSAASAHA